MLISFRKIEKNQATTRQFSPLEYLDYNYEPGEVQAKVETDKKILVITDESKSDSNLGKMIRHFLATFTKEPELIDLNDIDIKGACIGCMTFGYEYKCHYKDGFEDFYNNQVPSVRIPT